MEICQKAQHQPLLRYVEPSALTPKTMRYTPAELRHILYDYEDLHDHQYKIMPINAIKVVRNLKLNRKRRRSQVHSSEKKGGQT